MSKGGIVNCVEGARARIVTGPDHGLAGRVVTVFPHPYPQDQIVLLCVKDEPFHRHVFAPVPWVIILEEGEE